MKKIFLGSVIFIVVLFQTNAQWSNDPNINNPVCTAIGDQYLPTIVDDGNGGAIITWQDKRNSDYYTDIYAQKINKYGVVEWTTNGVAVCSAFNRQVNPIIVDDGGGGVIITWQDYRSSGVPDIYAQKIDSNGIIQWTANGIAICTVAVNKSIPSMVGDGNGGAIITWMDERGGSSVYVQRINSNGLVQWETNGITISSVGFIYPATPTIVSDGIGGAIITWAESRGNDYNYDIYAQRINSSGLVQWETNGIAICSETDHQWDPNIIGDGNEGAIIAWVDFRTGLNTYKDIFIQKINSSGLVQWEANGVAICSTNYQQYDPNIVSDGIGGAIITWVDDRLGDNYTDIYTQRIDLAGTVQWTTNGIGICTATSYQQDPRIISDGIGGAIIIWADNRLGLDSTDIYAQKIDPGGIAQWSIEGVGISTAISFQHYPNMVSDGFGGAIITWYDHRNGHYDIYASQIGLDGVLGHYLPVELEFFSIKIIKDDIELNWQTATETNNQGFEVQRLNDSKIEKLKDWESIGFVSGNGTTTEPQTYSFVDENLSAGKYQYRLKQIDFDGTFEYSNTIEVEINSPTKFSLEQNYPNPFNPSTNIQYAISSRQFVTLKIYDVLGKEVATLVNEEKSAGNYVVKFDVAQESFPAYASGVYFYQLKAGDYIATKKMILMK